MIVEGLALGLVTNPYSAAVGSVLAAVLWTRARSARGGVLGFVVLAATWFLGDGALRVAFARSMESSGEQGAWIVFGLSCAVSLLLGYVLPAWAGYFVGKRVVRGTGWISAGVVAASAAGAMYAIGSSLAGRL